jgi:hypothetical protein
MRKSLVLRLEPHDRRHHPRHTTPINITTPGETVSCKNWSLSGFSALGFRATLRPGMRIDGTLEVDGVAGEFAAKVVRVEAEDGEVGAQFIEVDPAVYGALLRLATRITG